MLFSGGYDSALVAAWMRDEWSGHRVDLVFVDYGQPYVLEELEAAQYVADHLRLDLRVVSISKIDFGAGGKFEGRNEKLVAAAISTGAEMVAMGVRNLLPFFDRYGDSNLVWARRLSKRIGVEVVTPIAGWPKWLVKLGLVANDIDLDRLYSTEDQAK